MDYKKIIKDHQLDYLFNEVVFGIERETLRTDQENKLALTEQPKVLGKRADHPYLITDFSESQPELVTPPQKGLYDTFKWLSALHDVYLRSMREDEFLWPFSMPNALPDESTIPIIKVPEQFEIDYREYLGRVYGKKLQMISGIHLNFSFTDEFINSLFNKQNSIHTFIEFKNDLYLKLTNNFLRYRWLITYLFGAAPYGERSFYDSSIQTKKEPENYMRSLRNSSYGYQNDSGIEVRYDNVNHYVEDIEYLVESGAISEEREYYGDARLRGNGDYTRGILDSGIKYVEFRSFDLNPFSEFGISMEQAKFMHLFFMSLIWMDKESTQEDTRVGTEYNENVASEVPYERTALYDEGVQLIETMKEMAADFHLDEEYTDIISKAASMIENPEETIAGQIVEMIGENGQSFLEVGNQIGHEYKAKAWKKPFLLRGFDTMEVSSQLLIFDAIQRGLEVEVLDEQDQFVRLSYKGHQEYVKNGNMTSKDTYISHWLMANKTVTKMVLEEQGYEVPAGEEYQSVEEAFDNFAKFENSSFVVKPKSTNFGLGISIFKNKTTKESYREALEIAFKEDDSVLVEEFVEGTEYRFFVLNNKTEAVLLRIPANVVGDGEHTISELIDQKNTYILRGTDHRAPMENIQKGDLEVLMLKEQGYDFDSIPEKDQTIYLRENSNISTGGDSIDFTDEMPESYKQIAEGIAKAIDVKVTGIDLIIPDYKKNPTNEEPGYSAIEANFNPAMNMHSYVYKGKGRRLTQKIIDMLFPELPKTYE